MSTLVLSGRVFLAAVFALAGASKLADRPGSVRSLRAFGLPSGLAGLMASALPVVELMLAVAILSRSLAVPAATGMALLLVLFIGAMAYNLYHGRQPDCHCFGQLHSRPVSRLTIVRNVLLAAIAAVVALGAQVDSGPSAIAWVVQLTAFERAVIVIGVLAAALLTWNTVLLTKLLRASVSAPLPAAVGLAPASAPAPAPPPAHESIRVPETAGNPVGSEAPDFTLATVRGDVVKLTQLRQVTKPIVLFFSDVGCGPCKAMFPEVAEWQRIYQDRMTLVVISRGDRSENDAAAREFGIGWLLIQKDREVANAYSVFGTPSAVRINADGTIATLLAQGELQIRELIAATADLAPAAPPPQRLEDASLANANPRPAEGETLANGAPALEALPADARPVKRDDVDDELMADGTIVLYNRSSNQVLTLNGTAALVWEYCDGEHNASDIVAVVRDLFPNAETAERDVTQLLDTLLKSSMILPADVAAATGSDRP